MKMLAWMIAAPVLMPYVLIYPLIWAGFAIQGESLSLGTWIHMVTGGRKENGDDLP